jgi:hypothetical protein
LLYGHWSGEDNLTAVQSVMERTTRIGDTAYLVAQLFWEFARLGNYDGELSFGITAGHIGDEAWTDSPTVYVEADTGAYRCDGVTYNDETYPNPIHGH